MPPIKPLVHFKRNLEFLPLSLQRRDHEPMVYESGPSPEHDGDRLRRLMERAAISQPMLADKLDVSMTAVGKWLKTGAIARDRIANICALLSCSADELLGLRPILSRVSEGAADYLTPDQLALLRKYDQLDQAGKDAYQKIGDALAQPPGPSKVDAA